MISSAKTVRYVRFGPGRGMAFEKRIRAAAPRADAALRLAVEPLGQRRGHEMVRRTAFVVGA